MSWLRVVRIFLPVVLQAIEVAGTLTEDKQLQRRFVKKWAEHSVDMLQAALDELQDDLDDQDTNTNLSNLFS